MRLLDELGFPQHLVERSRALSTFLELNLDTCTHLLSGEVPWRWDNIHLLCSNFSKEPGYFFDSEPLKLPSRVSVVTSVEGGASSVWCPPPGLGDRSLPVDAKLSYLVRSVPRVKAELIGMHVFHHRDLLSTEFQKGKQYVLSTEDGYELVEFDHLTNDSAIFIGSTEDVIHRVPISEDSGMVNLILGDVVGVVVLR